MYLQLWPGASLLGVNLISVSADEERDRRQITQASVFEVFTI